MDPSFKILISPLLPSGRPSLIQLSIFHFIVLLVFFYVSLNLPIFPL